MAGHGYGHEKTSGPFFGRSYPGLGPQDFPLGYLDSSSPDKADEELIGQSFAGPKGVYEIVSVEEGKYKVKYLKGDWKGKTVLMTPSVHFSIQIKKEAQADALQIAQYNEQDVKLGIWYEKFKNVYLMNHNPVLFDDELLKLLEEAYPELATRVDEIFSTREYE